MLARRPLLVVLTAVVATMTLACGSEEPAPKADPAASPAPSASAAPTEEPEGSPSPDPEPRFTVEVTVKDGEIDAPKVVEVAPGDKVSIAVTADVADHVHVHGYDELVDLVPGKQVVLRFTADIPGVWEVELEDAGQLLFELKVG